MEENNKKSPFAFLNPLKILFRKLLDKVKSLFKWTLQSLKRLIGQLPLVTGKMAVSYSLPSWPAKSFNRIRQWSLRKRLLVFGLFILIPAIGFSLYYWYQSLPKPNTLTVTVVKPGLTRLAKKLRPKPLKFKFHESAAPLKQVGKPILKGVRIKPKIQGKWKWSTDKLIEFRPDVDWQVGQEYTVSFDKKVFPDHVLLKEYEYSFETAPFHAQIQEAKFYIDPKNPDIKNAIATVVFSHKVDKKVFEDNIKLTLKVPGKKGLFSSSKETDFKYKVTYGPLGGKAYIQSDPIPIPKKTSKFVFQISKNVQAARGGPSIKEKLEKSVSVPGLYDHMQIDSVQFSVVRNESDTMDQVIIVQSNGDVYPSRISRSIEAYILPENRPEVPGMKGIQNYEWNDTREISPKILRLSQRLKLTLIPSAKDFARITSVKYKASPGKYVYVRLKKGISFLGNYRSGKIFDRILMVPNFPEEVRILHKGAILSTSGERKLSIMAYNLSAVRFEIGRVIPDQINHLISQTRGNIANPYFSEYNFTEDNIVEKSYEIRKLNSKAPGEAQYFSFDFNPYLRKSPHRRMKHGLFLFKVEKWGVEEEKGESNNNEEEEESDEDNYIDQRLILVTDLGILVKDNVDGSHDIFVQSLHTGKPISGAEVEVIGENGLSLIKTSTNESGHGKLPSLKDYKREKAPTAYIVRKGDDLSFLPYARKDRILNISQFDVGGLYGAHDPNHLNAYLFSDRMIYRPGESFHIGIMIKATDWAKDLSEIPLEFVITDSRGLEIHKEKRKLSPSGFEELTYQTVETAPTGYYQVNVYIIKDKKKRNLLGSTHVRIEEFLPDRMNITTGFSKDVKDGWVSPKDLKAEVHLKNLFGSPSRGHRVTANMTLRPNSIYFHAYRAYRFVDPYRGKKVFNEDLKESITDEKGFAEFSLNLNRFDTATYRLTVSTAGYEKAGGRLVRSAKSILISPLSYLIGVKPDGDLRYIYKGRKRKLKIIAINSRLKKIGVPKLKGRLIKIKYVSVLTKQENGTYQYQSIKKEQPVSTFTVNIPARGLNYLLPSKEPGNYMLVIEDQKETKLSETKFNVIGPGEATRSLEKNAVLQVQLNKKDYNNGEAIEVAIKSPYVGAGLITIEKDKVYSHKWFKTSTTSSIQSINVPGGLEGNGYVHVSFIRAIDSNEIYMNPLSYGIANFSVSRRKRTNSIILDTPEVAQPGKAFPIRFKTEKPGKIIVFAVDEGILQLTHYKKPEPLNHFYQKRALEVDTRQILDLLLPEYSLTQRLSSEGGDDYKFALNKNLNPFKRKRHKAVAYWSGIIDATSKQQELRYNVPDYFNGTLRVMAVVVSPDSIGSAERKAFIRGDFMISPNVPMFVAPKDQFEVSVSVYNNVKGSGKEAKVRIEAGSSKGLELITPAVQTLTIPENRDGSLTLKIKARQKPGNATLTFKASLGDKETKTDISLSIRPPVPYRVTVNSGFIKKDTKDIPITRKLYPHFRTLKASMSYLPVGVAQGLVRYLDSYPYGCTEQIVSRAFPALILKKRPEFGFSDSKVEKIINRTIRILRVRQNAEGAFGFWAANSHVSDFQVVYAMHFLTEAQESGYPIPKEMMKRGLEYLKKLAGGKLSAETDIQAYAIYVLTRNTVITTQYVDTLYDEWDSRKDRRNTDLLTVYLAASYQLMGQSRGGSMIREYKLAGYSEPDYDPYSSSVIRNAQYYYILFRHFPDRSENISGKEVFSLLQPIMNGDYNTINSAYLILALDAFAQVSDTPVRENVTVNELLGDSKIKLSLSPGLVSDALFSEKATALQIDNRSTHHLFYQLTQSGFDLKGPEKVVKKGVEVFREYVNRKGKPIQSVKLGEEIEVRVRARSLGDRPRDNMVIIDMLPGGFELVDQTAEIQRGRSGSTWRPEFVEAREDRVLLFGTLSGSNQEIRYRIRAVNKGTFIIPPIYAKSMYDLKVHAATPGGQIVVSDK